MSQRPRTLLFLPIIAIIAMLAGYWITHSAAPSAQPSPSANNAPPPSHASLLPYNKPLHRSRSSSSDHRTGQEAPPFALENERILQFKNDEAYQRFLNSLKGRGLTLLGQSDRLRAVRVGIGDLSNLDDIDDAIIGYNYLVTIPTPPQVNAQSGATGFGLNALSWLGVYEDNSSWGQGITVAVVDSGVNKHIALQGDITQISLVDLAQGSTQLSHGTAVASIISGDHRLTPGVAPASTILSVRVTDESGNSNSFTLAEGILEAVDAGAQVINVSMGSYGDSTMVANAVQYAQDRGVVLVASSGNEGLDSMAFPAAYEGVISVGAVEYRGDLLDFSNRGETLSITAPGYEVNAAWGKEQLTAFSGTSASAPFISGAIAATMSNNPQLTAQQAANLVLNVSNDAGYPGNDPKFGNGILDLGRIMDYGTSGIYDAAIAGQVLVPAASDVDLPEIWVTVQNQGTENLINSPVNITTPSGKKELNISSLAPGQIQTFRIPLLLPYNGDPVTITSSIKSQEADKDPSNNSRTDRFARETP